MNRRALEIEARELSTSELYSSLSWNEALADHFDENMEFNGYKKCQEKIEVVRAELARRRRE